MTPDRRQALLDEAQDYAARARRLAAAGQRQQAEYNMAKSVDRLVQAGVDIPAAIEADRRRVLN